MCVELLLACPYSVLNAPPAIPAVAVACYANNLDRNDQVLHAGRVHCHLKVAPEVIRRRLTKT